MRGLKKGSGWVASITLILLLTLISPALLFNLSHMSGPDWTTIGNIGQAYGFASAALAGVAFLAIAYSLLLQQQEVRASRFEAHRQLQMELVRMAMDDPSLMEILAGNSKGMELNRQYFYLNLWFQFLRTGFIETGSVTEGELRGDIRHFMSSEAGMSYWQIARRGWVVFEPLRGRRDRKFREIAERTYQSILEHKGGTGERYSRSIPDQGYSSASQHYEKYLVLSGLGAAALIAVGLARRRIHRAR